MVVWLSHYYKLAAPEVCMSVTCTVHETLTPAPSSNRNALTDGIIKSCHLTRRRHFPSTQLS